MYTDAIRAAYAEAKMLLPPSDARPEDAIRAAYAEAKAPRHAGQGFDIDAIRAAYAEANVWTGIERFMIHIKKENESIINYEIR